jgi:hypothetical protein
MKRYTAILKQQKSSYIDCWILNRPYALRLFEERFITLLEKGYCLGEIKERSNYFTITLELEIVGSYGVFTDKFFYRFVDESAKTYDIYRNLN